MNYLFLLPSPSCLIDAEFALYILLHYVERFIELTLPVIIRQPSAVI